jgi:hypothetical protein
MNKVICQNKSCDSPECPHQIPHAHKPICKKPCGLDLKSKCIKLLEGE